MITPRKRRFGMIPGAIFALAATLLSSAVSAAEPENPAERSPSVTFDGTVLKVGEASFAGVPKSGNNVIFRVDRWLAKPESLYAKTGSSVTVVALHPDQLKIGMRARVSGMVWILGEGICLKEASHSKPSDEPAVRIASADPGSNDHVASPKVVDAPTLALLRNVASSDAVVAGTVEQVRPAKDLGSALSDGLPRVSEHDANWQEAIIKVQSHLLNEDSKEDRVVVRFPGSDDVRWSNIPKLSIGEQGIFVLNGDTLTGKPTSFLNDQKVAAYVIPNKEAILSSEQTPAVKEMIKSMKVNIAHEQKLKSREDR